MNDLQPETYYNGTECLEMIKAAMSFAEYKGFLKGQIFKYLWRADKKGKLEDYKKAQWYQNALSALVSSQEFNYESPRS